MCAACADVDLRFKLDDLFDLLARGSHAGLFVTHDGAERLGLERRLAGIAHQIHADGLPGFRIDIGQHAGLEHDRLAAGNDVFQIRRRARAAVNGDRRLGALEAVLRAGVAPGRVAHHFDRELDWLRRAIGILAAARQRNAEQPALQQQRMRAFLFLRQSRAIRPIERREDRVLAIGCVPAVQQAGGGDAHPVSRLVTIHAGSPVGSQRGKERMAVRVHGARSIENAERSVGAVEGVELGQDPARARLDPGVSANCFDTAR